MLGFIVLDTDDGVEIGPQEGFGGLQPTLIFSPTTEPKAASCGCTSTSTPPTAIRTPNSNAS